VTVNLDDAHIPLLQQRGHARDRIAPQIPLLAQPDRALFCVVQIAYLDRLDLIEAMGFSGSARILERARSSML
jgi:hypothetical protein